MVIKHFTFRADDPSFANARPGSPHPFFSLDPSASSSPDVCGNCIGGLSTGVRHGLDPVRPEAEAADEVGQRRPDRNSERKEERMQMQQDQRKKCSSKDFFSEYRDADRYKIQEVIGEGTSGIVCSAIDTHTGEKVAIKKIHGLFEHISDATRILREIKLLRLLRHPDIVEIKHIVLPPSRRDFKDVYIVFELMESDLHQVIKANDDLTREHHRFFLY